MLIFRRIKVKTDIKGLIKKKLEKNFFFCRNNSFSSYSVFSSFFRNPEKSMQFFLVANNKIIVFNRLFRQKKIGGKEVKNGKKNKEYF